MVVPRFVQQALKSEPITVYGDGRQTRCFAHVKDVVSALHRLLSCPDAYGKVVNIGNPEEISMNDLAARVKAKTQSTSDIVHVPYEEAYVEGFEDMKRRVPDITLAARLIGFRPEQNLDSILDSVISYYSQ